MNTLPTTDRLPQAGTGFWAVVQADLWRLQGRSGTRQALLAALTRRCYRALFCQRLCQALAASPAWRWLLVPALLLQRAARHWAGIDLPWRTHIGPGLRIDHGWGLVINSAAVIGSNVTLFHGVTLGQADRVQADGRRSTGTPVIEDEVWIGPHAVVVGGITVGRGSRIAAGAFVTQDVPAHSLVVGNPAQVVKTGVPADVEHPWRA